MKGLFISVTLGWLALGAPAHGDDPANIALGARYTLDPAPNYPLCTDADDNVQLTDGKRVFSRAEPRLWAHKGTVGWNSLNAIPVVTMDLGRVQKISGASYSTGAGKGGVSWPRSVYLLVSDDNRTWKPVGDLVKLNHRKKPPTEDAIDGAPIAYRYVADDLRASGRYVAVAIQPQMGKANFVFCDEIEIHASDNGPTQQGTPLPEQGLGGIRAFMAKNLFGNFLQERITQDADTVSGLIAQSALPEETRNNLLKRIQAARNSADNEETPDPATFKTVFPFNAGQAAIHSTYGAFLKAAGVSPLVVTKQHRYFPTGRFLDPKSVPGTQEGVHIEMMRNEVRHDAITLTNATEGPLPVTLRLASGDLDLLPHLKISFVPWTDTLELKAVADALPFTEPKDGVFHAVLPAGLSTKVWISVNSAALPAGEYSGSLDIAHDGEKVAVPFSLRISPLAMNRPRLSCGMWDYMHPAPLPSGLTRENTPQALALMKSHGIDISWALKTVLPWPEASAFDDKNTLVRPLDFRALETWVHDQKDARRFFVFANVGKSFAGADMNTPAFEARVGEWVRALSAKLGELKVPLDHFALQLVDEPKTDAQDEIVVAWARAIRKANGDLPIFQNPTWMNPREAKNQDALTLPHILSPYAIRYEEGGSTVREFFEERRQAGQALWFYLCDGPIRHFDPTAYYRNFAWFAFAKNAGGVNFWALADIGGGISSWNEYTLKRANFAAPFFAPDSVTDSIHFTAIQEGLADHELLSMIRDRLETPPNPEWRDEAARFLAETPNEVLGNTAFNRPWDEAKDADRTDLWRIKALRLLERSAGR